MRCEVHNGLEDVFTPSPMDGVRSCEKICMYKHISEELKQINWRITQTATNKSDNKDKYVNPKWALPVTCVALARVRIKARFSSSDSADRTVFGSLRKRVNCGCTSELPKAVINRKAVLSTLGWETETARHHCQAGDLQQMVDIKKIKKTLVRYETAFHDSVDIWSCESTLPQMQLVLVGLRYSGQAVQVTEELDSVVRLDVVHPVAEHLQQSVKDSPCMRLEHVRQQLAWTDRGSHILRYL